MTCVIIEQLGNICDSCLHFSSENNIYYICITHNQYTICEMCVERCERCASYMLPCVIPQIDNNGYSYYCFNKCYGSPPISNLSMGG